MKDRYNRVSILFSAPFSLLYYFVVSFFFLLIQDHLINRYIWSYTFDPLLWTNMLLDTPWAWSCLLPSFYGAFEVFLVSFVVFYVLGKWIPIPEAACLPDNRGIDTSLNRFSGISLVVIAFHFAFAFYEGGVASGILLLCTLVWGIWMVIVPFEDSRSYSIAARCFPDQYDTVSASDLKKLFTMWIRRMRQKQQNESSTRDDRSYGASRGGAHSSDGRQSENFHKSKSDQSHQYDSSSDSGSGQSQENGQNPFSTVDSPWDVIGVDPGTPFKEVRKKWMDLCKRYHPDLVPSGLKYETEEALKKVNVAYRQIRESMAKK
jgi:hypothetical protein